MALKPIGKVYEVYLTFDGKAAIMVQLTAPLSVGDTITFDGWQEGVTDTVTNLAQNIKQVTTAYPGKASRLIINGSVLIGVNIYKVIAGEPNGTPGQPKDAAGANQPSQGDQNLGIVLPALPIMLTTGNDSYINNDSHIDDPFMQTNLAATGTEFLKYTPSYAQSIKAKPMSTRKLYIMAVLLLFLPIIILFCINLLTVNPHNVSTILVVIPPMTRIFATLLFSFVVSGLILLYVGFKIFSRDQLLSSTPASGIDVATYNLNKMQGTFMSYNAQPLKSPISNADCVHFVTTIYVVFYAGVGRGRHINVIPVGSIGKGVPALFTDNSGYLAVDLQKAPDVHAMARLIEVIPKNKNFGASVEAGFGYVNPDIKIGRQIAEEIMPLLNEAANSNTSANLLQLQDLDFKPQFAGKIINLKRSVQEFVKPSDFMEGGLPVVILETYIPSGSTYTCLGGAADIGKSIDNKPVKVFVPDQRSGTMAVHSGEAQKVTKGMSKQTIISLAFGILLLIGALLTTASYISYAQTQHSALATLSTTIPAAPISTTIPTTTQQSSITITSIIPQSGGSFASCANVSVFEPVMDAEASTTCNWTGGSVVVYAGGGNSGYASVKIIGSNNQTYFSNSTDSWCPTQIGSVYLPAQKYTILLGAGGGGGSCSSNPNPVAYLK
ncbi:MAG: hypothetical protein QXF41_03495 [Candidatus Micrarchaeaceae archaeon]